MTTESLVTVEHLKKYYQPHGGLRGILSDSGKSKFVKAVDDISFDVKKGEIVALVGESGSGKTTTGQLCVKEIEPTGGTIFFKGQDITKTKENQFRKLRKNLQMIYQDPFDSIDPRFHVYDVAAEGVKAHSLSTSEQETREMVNAALKRVGFDPPESVLNRYPHQLSGGQRQRVAFARCAILQPDFVVADEPVSMLDVSIKADNLNNMLRLRDELGISFLFITHDLSWARHVADRIIVMYLGKIVEGAPSTELVNNPLHPYTQALIAATPIPDPKAGRPRALATGEIPSAINVPPGCSFHPRCRFAFERCRIEVPLLEQRSPEHYVSCHLVGASR